MNINNPEFLLLSRTGRSSFSTRAGPRPFEVPEYQPEREARAERAIGRTGLSLRRRRRQPRDGHQATDHHRYPRIAQPWQVK